MTITTVVDTFHSFQWFS